MSNIAIKGATTGTGTFTIESPATNTDRTLTLPDEAGTVLTSASSIPVANLDSAVGITGADQWRLTTSFDQSGTQDMTTNLERVDTGGFGYIGTGMTESSGIFTFPNTGIWLITFTVVSYGRTAVSKVEMRCNTTTDNSTYGVVSVARDSASTTDYYSGNSNSFIFDVTNTTTHKVKFTISTSANTNIVGSSSQNETCFSFIRLGDT